MIPSMERGNRHTGPPAALRPIHHAWRPCAALAALLICISFSPRLASAQEGWDETDQASQDAARKLTPVARNLSVWASAPLLLGGTAFAVGAMPARLALGPGPEADGLRAAGLSLLGGGFATVLVGHAAGRVARAFAGGRWDQRAWTLGVGGTLLVAGYVLSVAGLTEAAVLVPGATVGMTSAGLAATLGGGAIMAVDAVLSANEVDRRLGATQAAALRPGLAVLLPWAGPRAEGGLVVGVAGCWR